MKDLIKKFVIKNIEKCEKAKETLRKQVYEDVLNYIIRLEKIEKQAHENILKKINS